MRDRLRSIALTFVGVGSMAALLAGQAASPAPATVSFARDVDPIFERSCRSCHGDAMQMGNLDLRTRESAMRGGAHGPVLTPANAEQSRLYRMVAGLELPAMPMSGSLSAQDVATLKAWIDQGARWDMAVSFARDVQPLFEGSCSSCHGDTAQLSRFDLRSRESALRGGARGSDILPGNAEGSRLYRRIAGLEQPSMPAQGTPLTAAQVAAVKQWIDEGAKWEAAAPSSTARASAAAALAAIENRSITPEERNYWAFKLPVQAPPPASRHAATDESRSIGFSRRRRRAHGLKPAPRADRRTLVRRAYLDLIGLPPTPAEVDAFVERQVAGRLGAPHRRSCSPRRTTASAGGGTGSTSRATPTPAASSTTRSAQRLAVPRLRDQGVQPGQAVRPFLVEQIAGDEMDGVTDDSLIATGFLRMGPRVLFREKDNPERRYDYLDDMIATIGRGMLGLTVNCARCHNHKFDPISQKDYYRLEASLFGYVETEVPAGVPRPRPRPTWRRTTEIDAKIAGAPAGDRTHRAIRTATGCRPSKSKKHFPENVVTRAGEAREASGRPANAARDAGAEPSASRATQVDRVMTPEDSAREEAPDDADRGARRQRPKPLPMAEIVTDGDYRFSPLGEGDETVSCPKCRIPAPRRRAVICTRVLAATRRRRPTS